jgi:hypothetical protein
VPLPKRIVPHRPRSGAEGSGPGRAGDGLPREGEGDAPMDSITLGQLKAHTAAMAMAKVCIYRSRIAG